MGCPLTWLVIDDLRCGCLSVSSRGLLSECVEEALPGDGLGGWEIDLSPELGFGGLECYFGFDLRLLYCIGYAKQENVESGMSA